MRSRRFVILASVAMLCSCPIHASSATGQPPAMSESAESLAKYEATIFIADMLERDVQVPAQVPAGTAELLTATTAVGPTIPSGVKYWRVEFPRQSLHFGGRLVKRQTLVDRRVVVFLSVDRMVLLRVEIAGQPPATDAAKEPDPAWYVEQMKAVGPETWTKYSGPMTKYPIGEALQVVDAQGLGRVDSAERIIIYLINWQFSTAPEIVAYSVDLRGMPPNPVIAGRGASNKPCHLRHIVDATTGRWRTATSIPEVEKLETPSEPKTQSDPPALPSLAPPTEPATAPHNRDGRTP
jgi:hypothetical protein